MYEFKRGEGWVPVQPPRLYSFNWYMKVNVTEVGPCRNCGRRLGSHLIGPDACAPMRCEMNHEVEYTP